MQITKSSADTVWVAVQNDSACSFTGNALFGGRGANAPSWAVWCFDVGALDSCSSTTKYTNPNLPGCWTDYDAHVFGQTNVWHVDTYDTYLPGSEDSSYWCGERGDTLTWDWAPGYANGYGFSLLLNLGTTAQFSTANGMTLGGVHIFSVELAYDYCFVEMASADIADTASFVEIGRFNGISNPDSVNCRGLGGSYWGTTGTGGIGTGPKPYLCADWANFNLVVPTAALTTLGRNGTEKLFIRWRVIADFLWDDRTGGGTQSDTRGAWRVDHVNARGATGSYFPGNDPTRTDVVDFENAGCSPVTPLCEPGRTAFSSPLLPRAEAIGGYWQVDHWVHGKPKVVDLWHLTNTPTYRNQAKTCLTSNRWLWASNLDTATNTDGNIRENAFYMRLVSPVLDTSPTSNITTGTPLANQRVTGNIIVYDSYLCIQQISSDATDRVVRQYDAQAQTWRSWANDNFVNVGGCQFWTIRQFDDWSSKSFASMDSVQYGFEMFDQCDYNANLVQGCIPGAFIANPHRKNSFLIDNASIGFFSQRATNWTADLFALFQDTFDQEKYIHPAAVMNDELKAGDIREQEDSLAVIVTDIDGLAANSVVLHYRISTNCGSSWSHETSRLQGSKAKPTIEWYTKTLNFSEPSESNPQPPLEFNGTYQTTLELNGTDFPGGQLNAGKLRPGTVIEYYITSLDNSGSRDTIPDRSALRRTFIHSLYGAERQDPWPFEVTVLPCAQTWGGVDSVLFYDDHYLRNGYDTESDPMLAGTAVQALPRTGQLYEEALRDLNVKYDRYDNLTSNISRGQGSGPFYTEPTDRDGYGGIRNPTAGNHRYNAVLWASGRTNEYAVTDTSQIEVGQYLASDANEGNIWIAGNNVCEDEKLTGIAEAFQGGGFWVNYVGASLVTGGCPDNDGITPKTYYVEGVNDANYTTFQTYGGWSDCPLRDQPDAQFGVNASGQGTELAILQFDNVAHTLNVTAGIRNTQPGAPNKAVTTMFGLENLTTRAARACLTRAILADFGVTLPIGAKYSAANCAKPVDVPNAGAVRRFALDQNYPNPFNPSTKIRYALPKDNMKVALSIFDVSGREVRTLVNRLESGAEHEVFWDGKNNAGQEVSSGVFFYRLTADDLSSTKKMVLLK